MEIKRVVAVCFSPTGGTRRYVEEIARRLSSEYKLLDLTDAERRSHAYRFAADELVIFGAPVYAGRLPVLPEGIFANLKGNGTPAVFNVVYGNRNVDDALLEEKDICEKNGFVGIAAGSWIAPHSFAKKVAEGRPDVKDCAQIERFCTQIKALLQTDLPLEQLQLTVPGQHPYCAAKDLSYHPTTDTEMCGQCNRCAAACPMGIISFDQPQNTDSQHCISCNACVDVCPSGARQVQGKEFADFRSMLEGRLMGIYNAPQLFFAE